ncbi:MAG: hypothetical protein GY795_00830 [Desulfobacterales bacterium]|nr:hypothetical protein [Desulfobacterales bacterium]
MMNYIQLLFANRYLLVKNFILFISLFLAMTSVYCCRSQNSVQHPSSVPSSVQSDIKCKIPGSLWDEYYRQGLDCMGKENYEMAIDCFEQSIEGTRPLIGKREPKKDSRTVETSRGRFIDYFPRREMGIAYYQIGELDNARKILETSITQYPSSKAKVFLERVCKSLIDQKGIKIPPPRIVLENFKLQTRDNPVILSCYVEDEQYISSISISSNNIGDAFIFLLNSSKDLKKRIFFKESLPLSQGFHSIQIEAKNINGVYEKNILDIYVDRQGPSITVNKIKDDIEGISISGFIEDKGKIDSLYINKRVIIFQQNVNEQFKNYIEFDSRNAKINFEIKNLPITENYLELIAQDRLGNKSSLHIPLYTSYSAFVASTKLLPAQYIKNRNKPSIEFKIDDKILKTKEDAVYQEIIYEKDITLNIIINSNNKTPVTGLWFNGEFASDIPAFFGKLIQEPLKFRLGDRKKIEVEAENEVDKTTEIIYIIRKRPPKFNPEDRLSFLIFPFFDGREGKVSDDSFSLRKTLIHSIDELHVWKNHNHKRFNITKFTNIIKDKIFSDSFNYMDKEELTAQEIGKEAGSKAIIIGRIAKTDPGGVEIIGEIHDTAGFEKTIDTVPLDYYWDDKKSWKKIAESLTDIINYEFPFKYGNIADLSCKRINSTCQRKKINTNLTSNELKRNSRLIIYSSRKSQKTGLAFITEKIDAWGAVTIEEYNDGINKNDNVITE